MRASRLVIVLSFLVFTFTHVEASAASGARTLPVGDIVAYSGAECGQIGDEWLAGVILGNGKFIPLSTRISALKKSIKKTSSKAKKKKLSKQLKTLRGKLLTDDAICEVFETGVTRPTGSPAQDGDAELVNWSKQLTPAEYVVGNDYKLFCPTGGSGTSVWGTDTYTADSSVCVAAVHAGLISYASGGNVTVRIKTGQSRYYPSLRNSVSTNGYGTYSKSFAFLHPSTGEEMSSGAPLVAAWNFGLSFLRGNNGTTITFLCPANGTAGSLWGTGTYTDDSSLCTAAVHNGDASLKKGGLITATIAAGLSSYAGSAQHGITSQSYGSWSGSFSL